ncbi:hypothetical protein [Streptomyces spinosirectus]
MQEFRELTEKERKQARPHVPKHVSESSLLRCTNKNCRRWQQRGNYRVGGTFPEPD